jgi:hypothetical protein
MTAMEQVQVYRDCIFEPEDIVEVRAIASGGRVRKFWRVARDLPGLVPELERLNCQGFNIYAGPNPRTGERLSGDESTALCRCLFVDFDKIEPGDGCGIWEFVAPCIEAMGLPMPTLAVFSGHGIHAYWRLTEPLKPAEWAGLQSRLIATLESDPACKNPERLMRLPGFLNVKKAPHADCFILFAEAN